MYGKNAQGRNIYKNPGAAGKYYVLNGDKKVYAFNRIISSSNSPNIHTLKGLQNYAKKKGLTGISKLKKANLWNKLFPKRGPSLNNIMRNVNLSTMTVRNIKKLGPFSRANILAAAAKKQKQQNMLRSNFAARAPTNAVLNAVIQNMGLQVTGRNVKRRLGTMGYLAPSKSALTAAVNRARNVKPPTLYVYDPSTNRYKTFSVLILGNRGNRS